MVSFEMLLKIHNNRPEFFYPVDLVSKAAALPFELLNRSWFSVGVSRSKARVSPSWKNSYVHAQQEPPAPPGFVQRGCALFAGDSLAGDR